MGSTIGLISSLIALACGLTFFVYAVKYYTSILIALATLGRRKQQTNEERTEGSMDGRDAPLVSIHLPFYNEANVARRVIQACLLQDYPNLEVLVADDSRDETLKVLKDPAWRRQPPVVKFIHRGDRSGFKGGALSEALRFMDPRAEFVVVFDADFIPPPDTVMKFIVKFSEESSGKPVAAVQGYQQHYLNKSENWVTRGIRAEFSGSYMVERVAEEHLGAMKMISGSVFMLRADLLKTLKWGKSITEDWELTIRLYKEGYRVIYTPLIQAPAEMPTTIQALAKQRMRWAEGHTYAVKKHFVSVLRSTKLTATEKLEFLYFAPYYLQSILLLAGSAFWVLAEANHKYPWFWQPVFGWSLFISNLLAAPVMCLAGLWLEGDLSDDFSGAFGLVALTYILAPYQGYAALKGLLEKEEGGWTRTLKTGSVTDRFLSTRLRGLVKWLRLRRFGRWSPQFGLPKLRLPFRGMLAVFSAALLLLPPVTALIWVIHT